MMLAVGYTVPQTVRDWRPLIAMVIGYFTVVVLLHAFGKGPRGSTRNDAIRIANALERVTHIPGWAAAMVGTATFGLLTAGMGFYNDVAWHVGLGRDKTLFTAPHSAIVVGLLFIAASSLVGVWFATATEADVGFRFRGFRIPWSAAVMGLFGFSALGGFPLDDLWHRAYGIDVTMWSPTHLLMIIGASLSPLASWLALGEAKATPAKGTRVGAVHVVVGICVLLGLSSAQGEFEFGVPQFQQLYHPILIALAAGFALTAVALVIRRWWAPLIVAAPGFIIGAGLGGGGARASALYITSAIGVALVGLVLGFDRKVRFAVASAFAISTVGLAGEWAWNRQAFQPWTGALLPDATILAAVAALGAALLGAAFASAVRREGIVIPRRALALAGVAVLFVLAWPLPRTAGDATVRMHLTHAKGGVVVHAQLSPHDAADHARWFQALAWQGGGMRAVDMKPQGDGRYVSAGAVPVSGKWKTVLRLQRGTEMSAIPIWLPGDAEIGKPEIPAVDRTQKFALEQRYLLREQHGGPAIFALAIMTLLAGVAIAWMTALVLATRHFARAAAPARVRGMARV
jgi:hypothetical protein